MNYLFLAKIFVRIFGFIFRRLEIIVSFVTVVTVTAVTELDLINAY